MKVDVRLNPSASLDSSVIEEFLGYDQSYLFLLNFVIAWKEILVTVESLGKLTLQSSWEIKARREVQFPPPEKANTQLSQYPLAGNLESVLVLKHGCVSNS